MMHKKTLEQLRQLATTHISADMRLAAANEIIRRERVAGGDTRAMTADERLRFEGLSK